MMTSLSKQHLFNLKQLIFQLKIMDSRRMRIPKCCFLWATGKQLFGVWKRRILETILLLSDAITYIYDDLDTIYRKSNIFF
jgi:hypothetical protein